jgi:arylformamidase
MELGHTLAAMNPSDGEWLDRMYNARAQVPQHPEHFRRWADNSVQVLLSQRCELDEPYGSGPGEQLDVFPTQAPRAPVLVFIHGGYWRSLDKRDHAFIAPAFTREGVCVVIPNYALCPAVTIPDIVLQMVRAVAWTWRNIGNYGGDPDRITVAGHSAGGHLAAMMLACLWPSHEAGLPAGLVRNALSIAGLMDLDPIMRTPFLQPSLNLTPRQVSMASPARLAPPRTGELYAVCGGDESDEFHRQMRVIREVWGADRVPVCESLPELNHFSVLEALATPSHRLHQLALQLLKG